jgi:hypothetical protein
MGELEYDGGYGEGGFVPDASDLTQWSEATPVPASRTPVSDRFWAKDGSPVENPELKSDDAYIALLEAQGALQAPSGPPAPDATLYADPGPGDQWTAEQDLVSYVGALQQQQRMESDQALYERVAMHGRQVDVADPDALGRVAGQVHSQVLSWQQSQLAQGASIRQLEQVFAGAEFQGFVDGLIETFLKDEAYRVATRHTAVRKWIDADWQRQSIEHEMFNGPPPKAVWQRHPSLVRMLDNMRAAAARRAEWDEGVKAIMDSHRRHAELTRAVSDAEYERTKTRKINR